MGFFILGPIVPAVHGQPFRFALLSEPQSLDPITLSGTQPAYVFSNLFHGLFRYDEKGRLIPIGAKERCRWYGLLRLKCQLNPKHKWSDGSSVVAEDYVKAMRRLVDPKSAAKEAAQLLALKSARSILKGEAQPETLGVRAQGLSTLVFDFDSPDRDFEYRLSSHVLVPMRQMVLKDKPETFLFSGPYMVKEWKVGKRILLSPNPHYHAGNPARPEVEMLFIDDARAGLNLFRSKLVDFIPMITTRDIPEWSAHPGLKRTLIMRFDYIGFGPQLKENRDLRKAIALGADFDQFAKLMGSSTPPGCTGFPVHFLDRPLCLKFDPKSKAPEVKPALKYVFTKIATDDLRLGAEFYQGQWKKNLGLNVELESMEFGVYRKLLQSNPPPIFRVGVALDRPTCLSALETFASESPDNFIQFKSKKFDALLEDLRRSSSEAQRKTLCRRGVELLTEDFRLVPQGRFEMVRLTSEAFAGIEFNEQGQIHLAGLYRK